MHKGLSYSPPQNCLDEAESQKPLVLIIDDQEKVRHTLRNLLEANGCRVQMVDNGTKAIDRIRNEVFDILIVDLKLHDRNGLEILKIAKGQDYDPEVILITGFGSIDSAIEAVRLGAFDYLEKPLDLKRLLLVIGQAIEKRRLKSEVVNLRNKVEKYYSYRNIIAESPQMLKILKLVDLISGTDSTVLIEGESGTGKELIARAIHLRGPRRDKPFIAVNCGALPEALLESELFGHVKGAFTGAMRDKKGLFEEAHGGTVLLDEIGDMPVSLQIKLLRVLQGGEVRRVGGNSSVSINTRVIASTNKNLTALVEEGRYREDLFYRLNVIPIYIPPLRERKEDIVPMVNHFMEIFGRKFRKKIRGFAPKALESLTGYDWPGNARQLENVIERVVSTTESSLIEPSELDFLINPRKRSLRNMSFTEKDLSLRNAYDAVEREYILKSLERNHWNFLDSARDLGISRSSLWRKIKRHRIIGPH